VQFDDGALVRDLRSKKEIEEYRGIISGILAHDIWNESTK
jgi:hypothetical protein